MTNDEIDGMIEFLPTGRIVIHDDEDGRQWTLKTPKFGVLNNITEQTFELVRKTVPLAKKTMEIQGGKTDEKMLKDYHKMVAEMSAERARIILSIISEQRTPESSPVPTIDDSPSWLLADDTLLNRIMAHWKAVPLARGLLTQNQALVL